MPADGIRIAKRIADSGLCSRREAERWIEAGRVVVNGEKIHSPALNVTTSDEVKVDGKELFTPNRPVIFRYHKPPGLLVTRDDPQGRSIIYDQLPPQLRAFKPVGRLDLNSEGLLLLANTGDVVKKLTDPKANIARVYRVRALGSLSNEQIERLANGVTVAGTRYRPVKVQREDENAKGHNQWYRVTLTEGKNREIRILFEHMNCQVNRLIRLSYGPVELGKLKRGECVELTGKHYKELGYA